MRIVVDSLPILGEAGIASFLRELLVSLVTVEGSHEYRLWVRACRRETRDQLARFTADPRFAPFRVAVTRVPDRLLEWCWMEKSLHVPLTEEWLGSPDLFLSTVYLTPVLRRVRVIMMAYDLIPLRFPQFFGADQKRLSFRIQRSTERAAAIIAISESTKRDFVELLGADPSRIHVVYPGVDARFSVSPDRQSLESVLTCHQLRPPYLLYVGSLGPHKNVGTLVRVFRRLKQAGRIPHQLVLCGRTKWGQEVINAAQDLIASGDCRVLDFIPTDEVSCLYRGAEAFAFLSLYEGFGLPPLEAMACGVPSVVSNAGSLPEVVGDAALQVFPTDEQAIEEALHRVLTDPELRRDLRERGFRQAARFSWPETARQTLKVFALACGAR